ncbi:hypothetical protein GCM10011494_40060 [Novosphingobium endophyticum]|uniref:Recombinase zinc beta ribbon domain-containing protein n=1 Tax=Novosphingobium endophyticum TaxID=1955250 RepID=A0A916TVW2_9SPHN|nr:hypothetical protein GCM10011494_40060 [Novosphingobium endophyticum]
MPEQRIIDVDLWQAVKERQQSLDVKSSKAMGMWDRRRPRYLFSGLMKCGERGGGYSKISQNHFGCSTARNKGTCANRRTIHRAVLESAVLDGLQHHLMDPELAEIFADEYTRHVNRVRMDKNASLESYRREHAKADKELDKLVDAICDGIPAAKVKDRMWELENRKAELERLLAETDEEPVYVHPKMGSVYRDEIRNLVTALNSEDARSEAAEIIRGLVDRIVLTPDTDAPKGLSIDLQGALAGILSLSQKSKKASAPKEEDLLQVKLVAGVGFEPTTFRL